MFDLPHTGDVKQVRKKWYLVTGGASGIGEATVRRLVKKRAQVIIVDKNAQRAHHLSDELNTQSDESALCYTADLTRKDEIEGLKAFVDTQDLVLSGLINAAGILRLGDPLRSPIEQWDEIYQTNLRSIVMCCKAFVPQMVERGEGAVVNIASASGVVGLTSMAAYSSMKFALVGYTQSLRSSLQDSGVKVSCICPGLVRTNILDSAGLDSSRKEALNQTLTRRGIAPQRVARAATKALITAPHVCDHVGLDAHLIHLGTLLFPHRASDMIGRLEQRFVRKES